MIKLNVAFIDSDFHCLYPNGISTLEDFVKYLNSAFNRFIPLELLEENNCVAPYFIEENGTKTVYYNPASFGNIQEREIYILPREEYNDRLSGIVSKKCVHCANYQADCECDLETHSGNISLDGECIWYRNE